MRRFIAGVALLAGLAALMALPLTSIGQPPNLANDLKRTVDQTVGGVNDTVAKLREAERRRREREAARRAAARPRQATPQAPGGYVPPLHGQNPHAQGTAGAVETPPSESRPLPAQPQVAQNELAVLGRTRGDENANGTYQGQISIAALFGNNIIAPVTTNPGETETFAPLASVLDPICNATDICLTVLNATSTTTATGTSNRFSTATASVGGPAGINATAVSSNANINEDANCQAAHGDSNVADASVGAFTADAIQSTSDSRECKDGTRTQANTSRVVNLGATGVTLPPLIPAGCGNGTPDTLALIPGLLPAVCNADDVNGAQAAATYGVREGLTTFALNVAPNSALLKATTGASESRAFMRAQCSDGVDNDGDGRIDFPNDPGCTGPTDDSEAGGDDGGDTDPGGDRGDAECEDGRDNDGDGRVDFPDDPGCSSRSDDSEAGGAGTAGGGGGGGGGGDAGDTECSDGVDNDGDGRVDFPNDPGCSSASDDSEGGGGNALAFTGTNLVLMFLIGSLALLVGLRLRAVTGRGASRAERAGMA